MVTAHLSAHKGILRFQSMVQSRVQVLQRRIFFFREGSISTVNYFPFPQFHFTQLQAQVVQAEALKAEKASMSDESVKLKEELGAVRDRQRATEKQVIATDVSIHIVAR